MSKFKQFFTCGLIGPICRCIHKRVVRPEKRLLCSIPCEVLRVVASCPSKPKGTQARVAGWCEKYDMVQAFGTKGDFLDKIEGTDADRDTWFNQWKVRVVQAAAFPAKANPDIACVTLYCIAGSKNADKEFAAMREIKELIQSEVGSKRKITVKIEEVDLDNFEEIASKWT